MHLRVRSYRFDPCPYYMFCVYRYGRGRLAFLLTVETVNLLEVFK